MLAGTVVNALTTFVLLGVVVRALGRAAAADFSVFWAVVVIAGLGFFLPMEQEMARRVARAAPDRAVDPIWRSSARFAAVVGALLAVPAVGLALLAREPVTALAVLVAIAGYTVQFTCRGVLSGRRRLARYGGVTTVDAVLRVAGAVALAMAGVHSAPGYQLAVSSSALIAGLAALVWSRPDRLARPESPPVPAGEGARFGADAGRLIAAAACMQALLNSGTLLAKAFAQPDQVALVATLLVTMTVARLPVFLFQSMQATYLTRLAGGVHRGEGGPVRRLLAVLAGAVLIVDVGLAVGAAVLGPWVVSTFFAGYQVTRIAAALVGASVAVYLAASVANDVSVAVGAHQRIVIAWPAGLIAGGLLALLLKDLTLRSILPLALGAFVALVILVPGIIKRIGVLPR